MACGVSCRTLKNYMHGPLKMIVGGILHECCCCIPVRCTWLSLLELRTESKS